MGSMGVGPDRNQDATVYVGDLDEQVTEELLWEFFLQCGPIVTVHIPRDKVTQAHSGFGFVEYKTEEDADYAMKILNRIPIFGRPIRVNMSGSDKRAAEVGANLYIGNLAPEIDEQVLYETFCAFGTIIGNTPKVMRDPDSGESKGFAFINFDSFEATDAAIEAMNGQYLCNRPISVGYAYKKDGTRGERHGSEAERLLAGQNPYRGRMPATIFSMQSAIPPPPPGVLLPPPPPPQQFMYCSRTYQILLAFVVPSN
jgi:splicing factor 3B subunit 4